MKTHLGTRLFRLFTIVLLASGGGAFGAEQDRGFVDRLYRDDKGEHKYVVFVPRDYSADKKWPVILFLHGAGERGTDGKVQTEVGLGQAIRGREKTFPFIAVFPQCEDRDAPARRGWRPETADGKRALAILTEVEKSYHTDKDRVYLSGLSMGGFGVWAHAAADPDRWAALVPICGGGDPAWAAKIARLPIWCFHGAEDRAVPVDESRQMIAALKKAGGRPKYSEFPGVEHNSWDPAYGTEELYAWLLMQKRGKSAERNQAATSTKSELQTTEEAPFFPALEIPGAVFVRLGNEMLSALADSLPQAVPADALSGTLSDMQQTTYAEGGPYTVQLRGISYRGRLSRAVIEARENDRVAVTLGLRDVNLLVNRTNIWGERRSATCGPFRIVLGHRADLPVHFVVQPVVEARRLKLKLIETKFRLSRDNWNVGSPEWVSVSGFGMTEDRVVSGLRSGLYDDPGRIEREVIAAVPHMLKQLEDRFELDRVSQIVAGLWPLPVYKPRLRVWPSDLRTDATGATVVLGLSVAALDEQPATAGPTTVELSGSESALAIAGEQFQFGLAPGLMEPVSAQMIAANAARVLVQDVPMKKLAMLADAKMLAELVPDLKRRGDSEVRSEFVLVRPLRMTRVDLDSDVALAFELPKVRCAISVRPLQSEISDLKSEISNLKSQDWVPFLDIDFSIRHVAKPQVAAPTSSTRVLALAWQGQAMIEMEAQFAPGYSFSDATIDTARIHQILADGWREWTELGALAKVPLDDLDLGLAKLRANRTGWQNGFLATTFGPAGILIRNLTEQPLAYEIKGPTSDWGGPYTLEPKQEHRFPIAYPVNCRYRANKRQRELLLPAGSGYEFKVGGDGEVDIYVSAEQPDSDVQTTSLEKKEN